jgi:UDP-3-O-[3-hydroxymyristoyl] glucosamine N-acyltransferase
MLCFAENDRFARLAEHVGTVRAVITTEEAARLIPDTVGLAISRNPRLAFCELHNYLAVRTDFYRAAPDRTRIDPGASVHPQAAVADFNVGIAANCLIGAHATLLSGSHLKENVVVQEGALIGGVGLQVEPRDGRLFDLEHAGGVRIEAGARIMANCVIARGLFRQETLIGADVRIGNLSFISHNVEIGDGTIVGHGAVVNGNVKIGRSVWIGPGATIANGVSIGDGARVTLGSVVVKDVPAGGHATGNFAVAHRTFLRRQKYSH